jgi:spore coat protein U domain-containing protein, fimbrial subunit CupE1/2/3/6
MTPVRSLVTAIAAALLIAHPLASMEQYPHGLMSTAPPTASQSCTIEARSLNFGNYDSLAEIDVDVVTQVIYTCTKNSNIRIQLSEGNSHSFDPRVMIGPQNDELEYNLYLDPTRRSIWGSGAGYTEAYHDSRPPKDTPVVVIVYGRIFRNQDPRAGQYSDSITAQIVF